ncbi:hypothetical protein [Micromonospora fulviviridis]|uniref:hypothetical protein n=1 Tax=Micromonospora fulviviridis TaxID=47860 RepID=UPI0037921442
MLLDDDAGGIFLRARAAADGSKLARTGDVRSRNLECAGRVPGRDHEVRRLYSRPSA